MTVTATDNPTDTTLGFFFLGRSIEPLAFSIETIPEPSSLALLGLGGLLVARRRR